MKRFTSLASALALAATLSTASLHAQAADDSAWVAVEIKDIKIELIDLTPDDGNTPWIRFTDGDHYGFVVGGDPFEMKGNDLAGEVTIGSNGNSATAGSVAYRVWNYQQLVSGEFLQTHSRFDIGFDVSPWTSVQISALARIDGGKSGDGSFSGDVSFQRGFDIEAHWSNYTPGLNATGEWLMSTVVSSAATESTGFVSASIDATTRLPHPPVPTPVPEPSTYAMLLAGIGITGAMARRKVRKARG